MTMLFAHPSSFEVHSKWAPAVNPVQMSVFDGDGQDRKVCSRSQIEMHQALGYRPSSGPWRLLHLFNGKSLDEVDCSRGSIFQLFSDFQKLGVQDRLVVNHGVCKTLLNSSCGEAS